MEYPDLVSTRGEPTPDGQRVIDWLNSICEEAEATRTENAALTGYLGYYYTNAYKGGGKGFGMSPAQWLYEHRDGVARAAYRDMTYFEEKAQAEAQQADDTEALKEGQGTLAAEFEALKEQLATLQNELANERKARKAAVTKLANSLTEDEPEVEEEAVEDEADAETDTEADDVAAETDDAPDTDTEEPTDEEEPEAD